MTLINKIVCDWCHREMSAGQAIPMVLTVQTRGVFVLHFHQWDCLRNFAIGVVDESDLDAAIVGMRRPLEAFLAYQT